MVMVPARHYHVSTAVMDPREMREREQDGANPDRHPLGPPRNSTLGFRKRTAPPF